MGASLDQNVWFKLNSARLIAATDALRPTLHGQRRSWPRPDASSVSTRTLDLCRTRRPPHRPPERAAITKISSANLVAIGRCGEGGEPEPRCGVSQVQIATMDNSQMPQSRIQSLRPPKAQGVSLSEVAPHERRITGPCVSRRACVSRPSGWNGWPVVPAANACRTRFMRSAMAGYWCVSLGLAQR